MFFFFLIFFFTLTNNKLVEKQSVNSYYWTSIKTLTAGESKPQSILTAPLLKKKRCF